MEKILKGEETKTIKKGKVFFPYSQLKWSNFRRYNEAPIPKKNADELIEQKLGSFMEKFIVPKGTFCVVLEDCSYQSYKKGELEIRFVPDGDENHFPNYDLYLFPYYQSVDKDFNKVVICTSSCYYANFIKNKYPLLGIGDTIEEMFLKKIYNKVKKENNLFVCEREGEPIKDRFYNTAFERNYKIVVTYNKDFLKKIKWEDFIKIANLEAEDVEKIFALKQGTYTPTSLADALF